VVSKVRDVVQSGDRDQTALVRSTSRRRCVTRSASPGLEQLAQERGDVSLHLDHPLGLLELGLGALGAPS